MTITTDNYESLLYQYAEGTLGDTDRRAVEAWLAAHPEAADELVLFSSMSPLALPPIAMPGKETLRRKAMPLAFGWYAAAACAALVAGLLVWLHPAPEMGCPLPMAEIPALHKGPQMVAEEPSPAPRRGSAPVSAAKPVAAPRVVDTPSEEERLAVAEVPTEQPLPKEETVVIIYEEILAPRIVDEPVLAWVAVDSTYSPTLADRLEDWSSQYTSQLNSQYLMARAEVLTRLSRHPFSRL